MAKCPLKSCDMPWEEHEGVARIVHSEKAEAEAIKGGARTNGGVLCDTSSGPCACGAWH